MINIKSCKSNARIGFRPLLLPQLIVFFLLLLLFFLAHQPFQIVIIVICLILSFLPYLHFLHLYHWTGYIIIMIYLGGLLILFLYFTTIMTSYKSFFWGGVLRAGVALYAIKNIYSLAIKNTNTLSNIRGVFCFSFKENSAVLVFIFFILRVMFFMISFLRTVIAPIRQN